MSSSNLANYPWPSTVNAANFISVKLCLNKDDEKRGIKDYKIWKKQMICLFESQDLLGFVEGKILPPEESMDEQKLWRRTDQLITGWILGSITGTDVLDALVGLDSSRKVWLKLEELFKSDDNDEEDAATGEDFHRYLPLHRAILRGDWEEGKKFFDKDKDAITAIINDSSETALHVAVETGKSNYFVRKLLEYPMPNETMLFKHSEAMLSKDSSGNTALHTAALAGNKEAAIMLVNKNPDLLYITNDKNMLPIHLAAAYSHKDTLKYLISVSKKEVDNSPFVGKLGASLLITTIASEFIDVALYLTQKYPELATKSDEDEDGDEDNDYALQVLAGIKSVFPSGENFSWWQNLICSCVPLTSSTITKITTDIENPRGESFSWWQNWIYSFPEVKRMKNKKLLHQQTLELVKLLCKALESLPCSDALPIYKSAIVNAAREGIHEVVEVVIEMFPNAIYFEESKTECTIFHIAARERVENIFNLIYHMNERKQYFYDSTDSSGNNFMHMCGELAPPKKLNLVSGAALQMQRELQWFKEMEKFVNPSRRTWGNDGGKTPQTLFSEKHQELKSQGEKWMKDTATSCTIAVALIATVVFAAAFTVPGGLHGDTGVPIFIKETSFILFAISDSVSMFTSTTSLLMFLSILTSRYAEQDFLHVLPRRLCLGLLTLFTSIIFMVVAFSAAIYITLKGKSNLFLIPVAVLSCLPVTSFALLQFPLLKDVMYSTYGPGIFGKKSDRILY